MSARPQSPPEPSASWRSRERLVWRAGLVLFVASLVMVPFPRVRGALMVGAGMLLIAWGVLCLTNYRGSFDGWAERVRTQRFADFFGNPEASRFQPALTIAIGLGCLVFALQLLGVP